MARKIGLDIDRKKNDMENRERILYNDTVD